MSNGLLMSAPISVFFAVVTLMMLAFFELGFRVNRFARSDTDEAASSSLGPMVGGLLGMLGFVLAFTFSMAASQHQARKQGVIDDANTIGTAFLRADLLHEASSATVRNLLREYVKIRVEVVEGGDMATALARTAELQRQLWHEVVAVARATPDTNSALMVQAMNDVIDMHEKRLDAALRNRIPNSVWIALSAITLLTMATLGIQAGLSGKRRMAAVVPLTVAFAVLVTLVIDLNRPQQGLIKVSQASMIGLQQSMGEATN
ncbi:MAG: hypothetical protein H6955_19010 [Chromatiaceae bacterium]|nr:hypothetical protein [Gammaproteobacteria bacterium]MCP5315658.1 hypothetical protein [Chromatiaceae bacterium]